jgi:putative flippase GtrA
MHMDLSGMNKLRRFLVTGALGTALHYGILGLLVETTTIIASIAAMIGASFGAIFNYYVNRKYTFVSTEPHRNAFPKFMLMSFLGVVISGLIVSGAVIMEWHYLIGQCVATLLVLVLNFTISNFLIFKK